MSHDISLIDTTTSGHEVEVFDTNITYNYSPALAEAGFHWADCDGRPGRELRDKIRDTAEQIERDPEKFRPLIKGDGTWGTPELLVSHLCRLAEACETHHAARFERY